MVTFTWRLYCLDLLGFEANAVFIDNVSIDNSLEDESAMVNEGIEFLQIRDSLIPVFSLRCKRGS